MIKKFKRDIMAALVFIVATLLAMSINQQRE